MYTNNRDAYRQAFFTTWQKYQKKLVLEPVEAQMLEVILQHPEYHTLLENQDNYQQQEFAPEENPFIHMSLHIAIREQIQLNRPNGIRQIHQALTSKYPEPLAAEHQMLACLANMIWTAQETGAMPSEEAYLSSLKQL